VKWDRQLGRPEASSQADVLVTLPGTAHLPGHSTQQLLTCSILFMLTIKKKFWEELIAYFPWYDMHSIENDTSINSSIVVCVFVAAVTFFYRTVA
jgi:hypothetical protein